MKAFQTLSNLQGMFANHPLTGDAPLRAWGRFAAWQLRSRTRGEVLLDWVGGQKLALRNGMRGATGNIYVGLQEFFDMMVPLHFLRQGDCFLDVGANVGVYTVLASGVCQAQTIAFEPDPLALRGLRRNIEVNRLEDRVRVCDCAVSSTRGEAAFTADLDTANQIANGRPGRTRTVRMERLDDVVSERRPAMLKADVETAELEMLRGAKRLLADSCLKVVELETVVPESARILAERGFEAACYDPFNRTLSRQQSHCKSSNSLFVRDWLFVADRLRTAEPVEILGRKI